MDKGNLVLGDWLFLRRDVTGTPKGLYQFDGWSKEGEAILLFNKQNYFIPIGGLYYCNKVLKQSTSALERAKRQQLDRAQKLSSVDYEEELASLAALDYSKLIL